MRSLKRERDRKRRTRTYDARDRYEWLTTKRWYPLARVVFLLAIGFTALVLAVFSIRSAWHTTTSHAPGAPTSSSHPPKDKARLATSLLQENVLSNQTHPWRKTVILLSIDGAKPQYLENGQMPQLVEMGIEASEVAGDGNNGIIAEYLQPRFPTLTFPNHWSLLTGLHVESHGIIANDFTIAPPLPPPSGSSGRHFQYTDPLQSHDGAWWKGIPLWATAERAGVPSGVMHWPGPPRLSTGDRPSLFEEYDGKWTMEKRENKVREWLSLPVQKRPQVMCLYIPVVDQAAHAHGPDSYEAAQALGAADGFVATLRNLIKEFGAEHLVDLIVVSDHGMTKTSQEKLVYLDELLDASLMSEVHTKDGWPSVGLHFKGNAVRQQELQQQAEAQLRRSLLSGRAFQVFKREELPEHWHWRNNERIAPLWVVPKLPWSITSREEMRKFGGRYKPIGNHGYDSNEPDMAAIFVARGPSFKPRKSIKGPALVGWHNMYSFDNTEVANLVAEIIGVPPDVRAPNNGTKGFWDQYLK
ncbi:Phosphodiest-domain-containing protein [Tilletiaria anomala UBC 951]|uniref:Phosphodiest-domain-containing protein n=1 Tax=Tilletiaria anomala (strain ATCC 24038 / CBS 436.72 / UBC 951) TaxID=1037660 RepID=A0A066VR36_TILAU|nr:Phosphodiest-domain-containing protein [Tilletiaria anomala UBC 951]KDN41254.1 Phosphodiest-domain-containing protein [Tilletiaria anomala UBC 951]